MLRRLAGAGARGFRNVSPNDNRRDLQFARQGQILYSRSRLGLALPRFWLFNRVRDSIWGARQHLAIGRTQRFLWPGVTMQSLPKKENSMFKHILVPTDGSTLSTDSANQAIGFAKEVSARITFLFAKPDYPVAFYGEGALIDPTTPEQFAEMAERQAREILSACERQAREAGVVATSVSITNDVPYEAIIDAADANGCDLIFMASHGRRGISGLLLGSETQKVLTHSSIPVLVYR
jgi:nucleotide-binding universal stress UspA family protein